MARQKIAGPTRQLYAQIREDIYLAAKARAAETRVPLRVFLEEALETALGSGGGGESQARPSVWDDEYLAMQRRQPIGSPVELTDSEASSILLEAISDSGC